MFERIGSLLRAIFWSQDAKKNVLFFMIGPPPLIVYWFTFFYIGSRPSRLSFHSLASRPVLILLQTPDPWYSFPPDFVSTCTCPAPRPISASTGVSTSFEFADHFRIQTGGRNNSRTVTRIIYRNAVTSNIDIVCHNPGKSLVGIAKYRILRLLQRRP